jgi:hypothetical protein
MSENDKPNQFSRGKQSEDEPYFVEIPAEQKSPEWERIPSGYDPMGKIHLRGRAMRSLSGGRIPWWVLISGWVIFGALGLYVLIAAVASRSWTMLLPLVLAAIPLLILWRGTRSKLSRPNHRRR